MFGFGSWILGKLRSIVIALPSVQIESDLEASTCKSRTQIVHIRAASGALQTFRPSAHSKIVCEGIGT